MTREREKELLRQLAHRQIDEIVAGGHPGNFYFHVAEGGFIREIRAGGEKGLVLMRDGRTYAVLTQAPDYEQG